MYTYQRKDDDDVAAQTIQLFSQQFSLFLKSIEFQKIPFYNRYNNNIIIIFGEWI